MAQSSFFRRPRAVKPGRNLTRHDSIFPIEKGLVTSKKRDKLELENHRRRYYMTLTKNSFQTVTNRNVPTFGEQDIHKNFGSESIVRNAMQLRKTDSSSKVRRTFSGASGFNSRRQQLVEQLVPECYDYIQNYHHYRNDLDRIDNGLPVPYLSISPDGKCRTGISINNQRRAGTKTAFPTVSRSNLSQPKHLKTKSRTANEFQNGSGYVQSQMQNLALLKEPEKTFSGPGRESAEPPKVPRHSLQESFESLNSGKDLITNTDLDKTSCTIDLECAGQESSAVNLDEGSEQESNNSHLKLNELKGSFLDISDINSCSTSQIQNEQEVDLDMCNLQDRDMLTSETRSGYSDPQSSPTVKVFDFPYIHSSVGSESDTGQRQCDRGHCPTQERDVVVYRPYLSPFSSRFPHLKASEAKQRTTEKQKDDSSCVHSQAMPPWMQYRVLCDALRSASTGKERKASKFPAKGHGYMKRHPGVSAAEIDYFIEVAKEVNGTK